MLKNCPNCQREFRVADNNGQLPSEDAERFHCPDCNETFPGIPRTEATSAPQDVPGADEPENQDRGSTEMTSDHVESERSWRSDQWQEVTIESAHHSESELVPAIENDGENPTRIGRFRVIKQVGTGGYGVVYKAYDPLMKKPVALKVPRQDSTRRVPFDKLVEEAQSLDELVHPNIATLKEVGQTPDGNVFLVMKWIEGQDLVSYAREQRLSHRQCAELVAKVARAVHYIHQRRFTHRDLKPANILVESETGTPFVLDLGLAIHESAQARHRSQVAGTTHYMSPEQLQGKVHMMDGRTDLWSLGIILYELLAGRRPFDGTRQEIGEQILHRDARPLQQFMDNVDPQLDEICLRLLSREPSDRFPSGNALADALEAVSHRHGPASEVLRRKPYPNSTGRLLLQPRGGVTTYPGLSRFRCCSSCSCSWDMRPCSPTSIFDPVLPAASNIIRNPAAPTLRKKSLMTNWNSNPKPALRCSSPISLPRENTPCFSRSIAIHPRPSLALCWAAHRLTTMPS